MSNSIASHRRLIVAAAAVVCFGYPSSSATSAEFDLVIRGGLAVDPETGLEAVRDVAINGETIAAVSAEPLAGRRTLDATGLVVAPGFIDLHEHGQDLENSRYQVMDGVTTALEMEVGVGDIDAFYKRRAGQSLNHFGASIGHIPVRMIVMGDPGEFLPSGRAARDAADDAELASIVGRIRDGLNRGALGVGMGLQYTPGATRMEVHEVFRLANEYGATCFVHIRHFGPSTPTGGINALEEMLAASAVTGASVHVVHVNSSGGRAAPFLLRMIAGAQSDGFDITTECYPYRAGMTRLESALFDGNWREALGIDYGDLQWVATGERLTATTYAEYRRQGGMVIMFMNPQAIVDEVVNSPLTMIASDGHLRDGKGHPRTAGTYCRVLGRYVREAGSLSLSEAIRKMTIMPAVRLERRAPAMKRKGRLQVGADADLVVFDPETVIDRSTYENPAQYSTGMRYVLVAGVPVVSDGKLDETNKPGTGVRAPIR